MSNDFYNVSGAPSQGSFGSSATIRAEFAALQAGFDKLPVLAANNSKLLRVNSSASGLEAFTHDFLTTSVAASTYVAKAGDTMTGSLSIVAAGGAASLTVRSKSGTPSQNAGVLISNNASAVAASRTTILTLDANGADGAGGDYAYLEMTGDSRFRVFNQASGSLELGTGGIARVTIAAAGNVSIAAPSSGYTLAITDGSSGGIALSASGARIDFTNSGAAPAQLNFYGSSFLELVPRNAAAGVKVDHVGQHGGGFYCGADERDRTDSQCGGFHCRDHRPGCWRRVPSREQHDRRDHLGLRRAGWRRACLRHVQQPWIGLVHQLDCASHRGWCWQRHYQRAFEWNSVGCEWIVS